MKRQHLDSSFAFIAIGLAVLAAILVYNQVSSDPAKATPKPAAIVRCPEDAVRVVTPNDHVGGCVAADDFALGTELRTAADGLTACQPVGSGVLEISAEDIVGWCVP